MDTNFKWHEASDERALGIITRFQGTAQESLEPPLDCSAPDLESLEPTRDCRESSGESLEPTGGAEESSSKATEPTADSVESSGDSLEFREIPAPEPLLNRDVHIDNQPLANDLRFSKPRPAKIPLRRGGDMA
jgi:hypothetical protein